MQTTELLGPCVCVLRHITDSHQDMLLAHEQVRTLNGINTLKQIMVIQPRCWSAVKAVLSLIKNLCSNELNSGFLRSNGIIKELFNILFEACNYIKSETNGDVNLNQVVKKIGVNLYSIIVSTSSALLILAKEYQNQIIIKDLGCLGFLVQMLLDQFPLIQKEAASLLAVLSTSKECAEVIEKQPGFQQFVHANFYNQNGMLKTISELASTTPNSNAFILLPNVTTLMQRIQDHNNQRAMLYQQPQQIPQALTTQQFPAQEMDQFGNAGGQQHLYYNASFPHQQPKQQFNQFN